MKISTFFKFSGLVVLVLFSIWFFFLRTEREERLIKKGNGVVEKIEHFKLDAGRPPNSLEEVGLKQEEGLDALYYQRRDSTNYILFFGTSLGESMTYYSDSKKWEDISR